MLGCMGRLTSLVRERSELNVDDVAAMERLFDRYYECVTPKQFTRDLAGKTHVIELRDGDTLCGFSTLCVDDVDGLQGQAGPVRIIFSGDTIIDRPYWGEQALALAFCRFAGRLKAEQPEHPLYWLLIAMGDRTYRYLHLFARHYHPRHEGTATDTLACLSAEVATRRFGAAYDRAQGLVRFGAAATRLRAQWQSDRNTRRASPAGAYFFARNPNHALGDELVCLCELDAANLRSFALKAFEQGLADA